MMFERTSYNTQVTRPSKSQSRAECFEEVSKHAASVSKLKCLLELMMGLTLPDIVSEWQAGALRRRGVTKEEVATVIEMLFNDTALRRQSLEAVLRD